MKKVISLLVGISILVTAALAAFAQEPIRVIVDGEQLAFDVDPVIENDRTLVPMRLIFEALGADVKWDEASRTASAVKDEITVSITIDNAIMTKNGENVTLDAPARLIGGRTLVPVRAVSEGLGAEVEWDSASRTVKVSTLENTENAAVPESLSYTELSDADMKQLQERYKTAIRYSFEQIILPGAVFEEDDVISEAIQNKAEDLESFAESNWNYLVMMHILEIQSQSETQYEVDSVITEQDYIESLIRLVQTAGLDANSIFGVTFETLDNGYTMMLLTFYETDTLLACKFVGIVALPSGTVRYFTAETDTFTQNAAFFCEVTENSRSNYGTIGLEKEDFLKNANSILTDEK